MRDDFYSFDAWVAKLREIEREKQDLADAALAKATAAGAANLRELELEANRVTRLGESDFKKVEEEVLQDQLSEVFMTLLENRQRETTASKNNYDNSVLTSEMIRELNATAR